MVTVDADNLQGGTIDGDEIIEITAGGDVVWPNDVPIDVVFALDGTSSMDGAINTNNTFDNLLAILNKFDGTDTAVGFSYYYPYDDNGTVGYRFETYNLTKNYQIIKDNYPREYVGYDDAHDDKVGELITNAVGIHESSGRDGAQSVIVLQGDASSPNQTASSNFQNNGGKVFTIEYSGDTYETEKVYLEANNLQEFRYLVDSPNVVGERILETNRFETDVFAPPETMWTNGTPDPTTTDWGDLHSIQKITTDNHSYQNGTELELSFTSDQRAIDKKWTSPTYDLTNYNYMNCVVDYYNFGDENTDYNQYFNDTDQHFTLQIEDGESSKTLWTLNRIVERDNKRLTFDISSYNTNVQFTWGLKIESVTDNDAKARLGNVHFT